ncbi:TPA: 3'-5' exoribonuclease [Candidatus Woesearchaeota archaeon]|nr:3'-5' exoribonuclease [Candidatus Woesearchaeota archaeon]
MVTPEPARDIELPKRYISVDVETSGRTPGRYSMLSIGACVVGDRTKTFYRELKPISDEYITRAMRVGCLGLECIARDREHDPRYDPAASEFRPELVLARLQKQGFYPGTAMAHFDDWTRKVTAGYRQVLIAAPVAFDGGWIHWYFDNFFDGDDPFGYGGEDIGSMYRGVCKNEYARCDDMALPREGTHHNALDDAIYQAKEMEEILRLMSL